MAIKWESVRTIGLFFAPIIIPKAIAYYRSVRSASRLAGLAVRAAPRRARAAMALLALLAAVHLLLALPVLAPENLFARTQSRLQIPVDVLFARVAALRPAGALMPADEALRAKFVNLESKLLYLQFGPAVVAGCVFCKADEPPSYFYYALPALLWPHLANLIALAAVTSPAWTDRYGAQWRPLATIAAAVVAALDAYLVRSYNYQANARALRLQDLHLFFWSMRTARLVALAALDAVLAALLYLSATHRAFAQLPLPAERIEAVTRAVVAAKSKMNATGIVKNTVLRDDDLRARSQAYWIHEVRLMREVMEERDVVEGVNDALNNRINIQHILSDADAYSQGVLRSLQEQAATQEL